MLGTGTYQRERVQIRSTFSSLPKNQSYPHYSQTNTIHSIHSENGVLRPGLYARGSLWSTYWFRLWGRQRSDSFDSPMHPGNICSCFIHDIRSYAFGCVWFQQPACGIGLRPQQYPRDCGFRKYTSCPNERLFDQSCCCKRVSTKIPR